VPGGFVWPWRCLAGGGKHDQRPSAGFWVLSDHASGGNQCLTLGRPSNTATGLHGGPGIMLGRDFPESLILDLTRADRDPAWPLILAQLLGRQPDLLACDAPLAAAVAAHAAAQALAYIDRPAEAGAVANGTLELVLPSWQWRRRTWPPHPDCDCGSRCRRTTPPDATASNSSCLGGSGAAEQRKGAIKDSAITWSP
jgi:hypothetical protein